MKINLRKVIIFLLSYSSLGIFIAWDTSFNMQVLLPVMLLIMLWAVRYFHMKASKHILEYIIALFFVYFSALLINGVTNPEIVSTKSIIRTFYSCLIVLYYGILMMIDFRHDEIRSIVFGNFVSSLFISFSVIHNWKSGARGKISLLNIFGKMVEENYTAALLAFSFILGLLLFFHEKSSKKVKAFIVCGLVEILFSVLLTGSRGGLMGLAIGSCVIVLYVIFNRKISQKSKILFAIGVLLVYFCVWKKLDSILPNFIFNRMIGNGISSLNDNSNYQRVTLWLYALNNWYKHPLLGFGIGNFSHYVSQIFTQHTVVVAHNTYIDILIDSGLVGFILTLKLWFFNVKSLFNKRNWILFSLVLCLGITSFILGAERTFFVWNGFFVINILLRESINL